MYNLFVDESTTYIDPKEQFFVMAGVIIEENNYSNIENMLNTLKLNLWNNTNIVLHEKDVSFVTKRKNYSKLNDVPKEYHIFKKNENINKLYNGLSKIFKDNNIKVIGVCLNKAELDRNYSTYHMNSDFTIAIQLLIEIYCQFLIKYNTTGNIIYESLEEKENIKIQQRLYELKALGTLFYKSHSIQRHIKKIEFIKKTDNNCGLQLADFTPNCLGRSVIGAEPKNKEFKKNLLKCLYDGSINNNNRFGLKILP
mgnify:CR=1 FL=1